jgi:3-deoxy-D-manno-octulosonic-acid transferase
MNAKMSPSSHRGYRRLLRLWPRFLEPVAAWLAQSEAHADRIRTLGVPAERVRVCGNVKFDNVVERDAAPDRARLRREHGFDPAAKIIVAGSTHRGEESALLAAFGAIREGLPELRLVLCPRHRERISEVAELVRRNPAWELGFRTSPSATRDPDVLVVDSMGELSMLYALADVAYVGGTLVPIGGHNLLEPASLGLPIVVGRHLDTVLETAAALRDAGALVRVEDEAGLPRAFADLLRDPRAGVLAAQGAREVIRAHRGSVARTMDVIAGAIAPARPLELHAHG